MKRIINLLGIIALSAVIVFSMTFCGGGEDDNNKEKEPEKKPIPALTGTVTVTSNVTFDPVVIKEETNKLTASINESNGSSYSYDYQWRRDGADISGAKSNTYDITTADYGKTISVKVTSSYYSGEVIGTYSGSTTPTILNLTLKRHASNLEKETGVRIERVNGSVWKTTGDLTTSGTTIKLTSWTETQFKMGTTHTYAGKPFYFAKENAPSSELDTDVGSKFDLTNGSKTYILENKVNTVSTLIISTLTAKEGT